MNSTITITLINNNEKLMDLPILFISQNWFDPSLTGDDLFFFLGELVNVIF
jgi:hypothetical protein